MLRSDPQPRTLARAVLLLALIGCAAASTPALPTGGSQYGDFDPRTGRFNASATLNPNREPDRIPAAPDRAWERLPEIYAALGIPMTVHDSASRVMGVYNIIVRRALDREPLSRALECGRGSFGPNADSYEVAITVLSKVRDDSSSGTSLLDTRVTATAVPNGLSTRVVCSSTGRLEERIAERLRLKLAAARAP